MKLPLFVSVLAFVAGVAAGPFIVRPALAGPPGSLIQDPTSTQATMPDQSAVQGEVNALQTRVTRLQAEVTVLGTHKHGYRYWAPPPGQYVSLAELRDAMQAHGADAATTWVAVVASAGRPQAATSERGGVTDGPTAAP